MRILSMLLLLGITFSFQARAEILFLDFNGAPEEVAAAERAAKARGEKLIVLPKKDPRVEKIGAEARNLIAQYDKACGSNSANRQAGKCEDLVTQRLKKSAEYYSESRKLAFNYDSAKTAMAELAKNKVEISSLVVSGHDGTGNFSGGIGGNNITAEQLQSLGEEYPDVFKNMRGLMLWGCYTGTPGAILGKWKKAFPNAELIAGYDGRAPLANSPSSSKYLEDVLIKEKELAKIKDKNELAKAFKGLKDISNVHGAICSGNLFASQKGVADADTLKKMCDSLPIAKWNERLTCYKAGLAGCENVPKDTAAGELRQIYNEVHAVEHCRELDPEKSAGLPDPENILRLMFFENVKKNYLANYKDDIPKIDELLKKIGAPDGMLFGDIEKLSRAEIVKKLEEANNFLKNRRDTVDLLHDPLLAEALEAQSRVSKTSVTLGDVAPFCVNFDWVEPGATSKSRCDNFTVSRNYTQMAESFRYQAVDDKMKKQVLEIVRKDPAIQELEKLPPSKERGEKLKASITAVVAKYQPEISKAVEVQRADIANQTPIPDGMGTSYKRTEALAAYDTKDKVDAIVRGSMLKGEDWGDKNGFGAFGGMEMQGMVIPGPGVVPNRRNAEPAAAPPGTQ